MCKSFLKINPSIWPRSRSYTNMHTDNQKFVLLSPSKENVARFNSTFKDTGCLEKL